MKQFDFGQNWSDLSANAATVERVAQARAHFSALMRGIEIEGKSFLDIGFGQGFSLLSARAAGAVTVGCDISPKCLGIIDRNRLLFPGAADEPIPLHVGSILDDATVKVLRSMDPAGGRGFDIVHSWGGISPHGRSKAGPHQCGLVGATGRVFRYRDLQSPLVEPALARHQGALCALAAMDSSAS